MIDKRSSDYIILLDISHLHHGHLLELAVVSIKVCLLAASTAAAPGFTTERGWSTYWILINVDLPAIDSHGILQVVLEVFSVLQYAYN